MDDHDEPLSRAARSAVLAGVVLLHVAAGWALTQVSPARLLVSEGAPMEVRMVAAQPPSPPAELLLPPPPEDTPPPKPELESIIQPPPPDLPPPAFPVQAPPPAPPKPKPPPPRPRPAPAPAVPVQAAPQPSPAAQPAAPKTVAASQVAYLTPPRPIYPARARRAGDTGTVMLRVLIDPTGRPGQVTVEHSSGHPELDQSALSAVRAAQFRPYAEGGVPQAVWVLIPINFVLQ